MVLGVPFQRLNLFKRKKLQGISCLFLRRNFSWQITGHGQDAQKGDCVNRCIQISVNVKAREWTHSRREGSHRPRKRTVRVMRAGMQIKEILLQVSKSSSEAQAGRSCRRNSALFHELVTGSFLASQCHPRTKLALRCAAHSMV